MTPEKMGQFIARLRKSRQMTQKELAEKLQITDKAVSKWERGLSCPDISLLTPLAEIFDVTVSELLNGGQNDRKSQEVEESVENALQYAGRSAADRTRRIHAICAIAFSLALFLGALVCFICDLAVSGSFTWSPVPIASIAFAWLVLFPLTNWGERGLFRTLVSLTVFIFPYLWILNSLVPSGGMLLPISIPVSAVSLLYLWATYALFRFLKGRKLLAETLAVLLEIPLCLAIDVILSRLLDTPIFDVWDALSYFLMVLAAIALIAYDCIARKKRKQ